MKKWIVLWFTDNFKQGGKIFGEDEQDKANAFAVEKHKDNPSWMVMPPQYVDVIGPINGTEVVEKYVLRDSYGAYLTGDFETWTRDVKQAHLFIKGGALNACYERWRKHGVRIVTNYESQCAQADEAL